MADFDRNIAAHGGAGARAQAIDVGLRDYMLRVYNYMASGLALTGIIAYLGYRTDFYASIAGSPLIWLVLLAPLGVVFYLSARINSMSFSSAQTWFWIYAGLVGLSLSGIFYIYSGVSITRVFFITAGMFGAVSLYGYTTKRDLSGFGSFLFMGLIGVIIASVVNIFLASSALHFAISVIGVLVFTGLTAYDTQKIKEIYYAGDGHEVAGKKSIMGALSLYLDFLNMFLMMLRLFGGNRE
jgi:uncharacterized protein